MRFLQSLILNCNLFLIKAEYSALLLQSSVSHDPLEITQNFKYAVLLLRLFFSLTFFS